MSPTSRSLPLFVAAVLAAFPAAAATAQSHVGRIEGTVFDSLTAKPAAGAVVTVSQLAPASQLLLTATTDSAGHYVVDSLLAGRYAVGFSTPFLDSLELQFPQREVSLADGARVQVDFATPSRTRLAAAACPGLPLGKGRGAIVGQIMNADTDQPLGRATVALSWNEVSVDLKSLRPVTQHHDADVPSDSLGQYRACNVPTDTYLVLQVQHQGRAGAVVRTAVPEAGGVMLQNLSLSQSASRAFVAADSTAAERTGPELTGTATLTGTVLAMDGRPLPDAQVRVIDAAGSARSDAAGRFTLGNLPSGTQVLEVRRVGYLLGYQPVELRSARTAASDVRLSRIVTLDSVRVVAQRTRLREFESRTGKARTVGSVITADRIETLHPSVTSDLLKNTLGFSIVGEGMDARLRSTRGLISINTQCEVNVVIDGMQHQAINLVSPGDIAGIEVYRGPAGAPPEYDSACGAVVIWTKR
jgi:hypothetical protein